MFRISIRTGVISWFLPAIIALLAGAITIFFVHCIYALVLIDALYTKFELPEITDLGEGVIIVLSCVAAFWIFLILKRRYFSPKRTCT